MWRCEKWINMRRLKVNINQNKAKNKEPKCRSAKIQKLEPSSKLSCCRSSSSQAAQGCYICHELQFLHHGEEDGRSLNPSQFNVKVEVCEIELDKQTSVLLQTGRCRRHAEQAAVAACCMPALIERMWRGDKLPRVEKDWPWSWLTPHSASLVGWHTYGTFIRYLKIMTIVIVVIATCWNHILLLVCRQIAFRMCRHFWQSSGSEAEAIVVTLKKPQTNLEAVPFSSI